MKDERFNYAAVGAFVLTVLCVLVASLALLTGKTGGRDRYFTNFDDVTGLKYGSQVLYMGFPVGQVESILPVVDGIGVRFKLSLAIDSKFSSLGIPRDSVAQIRAAGLLAAKSIYIRAGSSQSALRPQDTIAGLSSVDPIVAMSDSANAIKNIAEKTIAPLFMNLKRYVDVIGVAVESHGADFIKDAAIISEEFAKRAPAVLENLIQTSAELRATTVQLRRFLNEENSEKIGTALGNILAISQDAASMFAKLKVEAERFTARIQTSADNLELLTRDAHSSIGHVLNEQSGKNIKQIIDNIQTISENLADTVPVISDRLERILRSEHAGSFDSMITNLQSATAEVVVLIRNTRTQLDKLLGGSGSQKIEQALSNVAQAAESVSRLSNSFNSGLGTLLTDEMVQKVHSALDGFSAAALDIASLSTRLSSITTQFDALLIVLNDTVSENRPDVRRSIKDLRHTLDVLATHVDSLSKNLEGTSRNMYEFSRTIKQNPGLLLRGVTVDDDRERRLQ